MAKPNTLPPCEYLPDYPLIAGHPVYLVMNKAVRVYELLNHFPISKRLDKASGSGSHEIA